MNIFYAVDNQQQGPIPLAEFQALVTRGTVTNDTLVYTEGMKDWLPLSQARSQGFMSISPASTPEISSSTLKLASRNQNQYSPGGTDGITIDCPTCGYPVRPHHRFPKFVQHQPGCAIGAKSKNPLKPKSADTILLACHMPHPRETNRQRQLGVLKNRAHQHRTLPITAPAPPEVSANRKPAVVATFRANKTIRPSDGGKVCPAASIVWKGFFQLHHIRGVSNNTKIG